MEVVMLMRVRQRLRTFAEVTETVTMVAVVTGFILVHMGKQALWHDTPSAHYARRSHY